MDNINNLIRKTDNPEGLAPGVALKDTDVVQIWDEVSGYIDKFMTQTKGVQIPNFGTFTFVQKKIDIGNSKYVLVQRPVFSIAEKFAQTHGLNCTKYPVTGSVPVHPLNYTAIANETPFTRDTIENCVKHVLQVFNRSVQSRKNVEFTFTGIGKLQIRNSKVKMKFFKEFVNSCDQTGKVVSEMQNRPHTADSVMSRNDTRAHSRNTCILPRINSRAGAITSLDNLNNTSINNGAMDTISEEISEGVNERIDLNGSSIVVEPQAKILVPVASVYSSSDDSSRPAENSTNPPRFHIPEAFRSHSFVVAPARSEPNLTRGEAEAVNSILNENNLDNNSSGFFVKKSTEVPAQQLARPSSRTLISSLVPKLPVSAPSHAVSCGHQHAGQELCYLCHQRHRRNNPVYLHEEQKAKEKEESELLMRYQQLRDLEQQMKDDEKRGNLRLDRAKMDAFNLGVSEAIKAKKNERPKTSDLSRSIIFRRRAKTPPKLVKQQDLSDYLSRQIETRQNEQSKAKQELEYLEKMEQVQLAEELAAQREAYLKEKRQKQVDLKTSLDVLVKNKPPELPKALPDSEVFGQHDAKNERLAVMKKKELETSKYHKELIEQRKREQLLAQMTEQEIDAENIERVKEEYKIDRANRFNRMISMRRSLEKDWKGASEEKKQRDVDEREHRMAHDGFLVHEQCDKYRRCDECKRDVKNCGESNVWRESRYTAGTRLMV